MESKILNLQEGLKLASIISKYLKVEEMKEMTGKDFGYYLFDHMEPDEVITVSRMFVDPTKQVNGKEIIHECVDGMVRNNVIQLVEAFISIGFGK